ncbi:MAG: Asp-tRNA(Asn)/Glu-tRNA(Gln) amidotransferase subunit GatA [Gammaproteobacteria bacterium]|nr:Asp-tRNA(Asn)/Glu-tRNA(Gln) amidotransferase subunit GatA [Gammaproteobacteria bacterium]
MQEKTLSEHAKSLRSGEYSSVELTQHYLDRIQAHQNLNAFISVTTENALAQAQLADKKLQQNQNNPTSQLTGIPLAQKDIFCTRGVLTTCGSRMLENFVSPYDSTIVEKLNQSGMIMLGKTNMDEFAMGSSNETSFYGPVRNPWNTETVPGGSSGGSASAVAARLTPVATASDTGGSIRQPAAFCGLSGIKPSYGRVSRYGMIAFASSLDQAGVLSRSIEDGAMVLQAMSGFDERDSTSLKHDVPDYVSALGESIAGKTIGLPREFFGDGVSADIADKIQQSIRQLESMGAKTIEVELPNSAVGIPCYYVLAPAEASSNLSRFDGVRYGHRAKEYGDLNEMYEQSRAEGFGDEVQRRIMIGAYVLSSGYYDAYYIKAQRLRRMIAEDFDKAFEKCDLIAGPTTPSTAFVLGENNDDPIAMYLNDIFTNSVNLAGLPGLSIPAGFDNKGLPVGLHLIGKYLDESTILNVAHQYQMETDWHLQIPGGFA